MTDQLPLRSNSDSASPQPPDSRWRTEITARVAGYRSRRGRRIEGAFSMRFPFPPAISPEAESETPGDLCEAEEQESTAANSVAVAVAVVAPDKAAECASESSPDEEQSRTMIAISSTMEAEASPIIEATPEPEPSNTLPPTTRPPARRKVIAFPRQASLAPETYHRLADPVVPEQQDRMGIHI